MTKGLSNNSVLLFTGGGKGITAQCAIALSEQVPCTYLLLGRSQLTQEPEWALGVVEDAALKKKIVTRAQENQEKLLPKDIERIFRSIKGSREIEQTLGGIRDNGARAFYVHADVTNLEEVKEALSVVQKTAGEITGLVHGAGRLADKRIERKTEDDFHAVFDTKVSGLTNVLEGVSAQKLNLLVLFSSVAGAFGNIGQSDYAMANEVLNKFVFRFQKEHPSCHTLSINWGPWDSGMVTPMLKKAFADAGILLISKKEGTQRFVDEVLKGRHPSPQIIVGSVIHRSIDASFSENEMQVRRVLDPDKNLFLLDHQIGPNRVFPATCAASWMADTCGMLFPSYRFSRLENYRVFKGVVFYEPDALEFITRVKVVDTSGIEEIRLQVRVVSSSDEQEVLHYQAEIVLKKSIPVTDKSINPNQWMKSEP
ncbi:MAG: SDR family NAD(P)-dependent oxidoreductase, partial [Anaerolineaceae bacterium]|nr:SDR family NAD(P)-dependent oxidoreductase [Anaerolineaceae bacterium]